MKNILKVTLLSFILIFVTGCMDLSAEMEIKKDKSMTFSISEMVDSEMANEDLPYFKDSDIKKYKESGFTVSNYIIDDKSGHSLSKDFTNIDEVSSSKQLSSHESTKALLGDGVYIFTVKKGIFKNKYYAAFNVKEFIDYVNKDTADMSNAKLEFSLILPYKAITSNATSVTNHGKKLEWNLGNLDTDQIYFEFKLYNLTNIYLVLGGIGLALLLVYSEKKDKKLATRYIKK